MLVAHAMSHADHYGMASPARLVAVIPTTEQAVKQHVCSDCTFPCNVQPFGVLRPPKRQLPKRPHWPQLATRMTVAPA